MNDRLPEHPVSDCLGHRRSDLIRTFRTRLTSFPLSIHGLGGVNPPGLSSCDNRRQPQVIGKQGSAVATRQAPRKRGVISLERGARLSPKPQSRQVRKSLGAGCIRPVLAFLTIANPSDLPDRGMRDTTLRKHVGGTQPVDHVSRSSVGPITGSNVIAHGLEGQRTSYSEGDAGMATGQGSVGRITQLPVRLVEDFRQDFDESLRGIVIDFAVQRRLRRKLDVLAEVTEAVDDRTDLAMNLIRATTDTANTERKMAKVGFEVIRVRRSRTGKVYTERTVISGE